jgi:hypothetical protein
MPMVKLLLEGCNWVSLSRSDVDVILEELEAGHGMAALRKRPLAATPPKLGLTIRDKQLEQCALRIWVVIYDFRGPMHGCTSSTFSRRMLSCCKRTELHSSAMQ